MRRRAGNWYQEVFPRERRPVRPTAPGRHGGAPLPEQQAVTAEQAAALREAIGSLPSPERELFIRHYYLDQPVAKIAAVTGQNPATLRGRLMRGRAKLKEMLTKRGVCNE